MKKSIFLLILVIILVSIVSCDGVTPQEEPQASFDYMNTKSFYNDYTSVWDVFALYYVTNTGNVTIDNFEVCIEVICVDGPHYSNWDSGQNILPGERKLYDAYIPTDGKEGFDGWITDYLLETY